MYECTNLEYIGFDNALKTINGQVVSLVKIEKPFVLDSYINNEKVKAEDIIVATDHKSVSEICAEIMGKISKNS